MRHVVVVGGGIAGLAAAYRLVRLRDQHGLDIDVTLLEGSARLGGKIRTEKVGSLVIESGPDSFLTTKPDALNLAREVGLGNRILPTSDRQRDVYVYLRGKLRRMPDGLMLMAPTRLVPFMRSDLLSMRGKLRMGLERVLPPGNKEDESLADFTRRRLGPEALEAIVEPLMAGIFAGDVEQLSLKSTFPQFAEMERKYGSIIKGMRANARAHRLRSSGLTAFASFMGGLEELVDALSRSLGEASLKVATKVNRITRAGLTYKVETTSGELPADALVLAIPASDSAGMVESMDADLAGQLRGLSTVSTATLALAFRPKDLPQLPPGFGFVVPKGAGITINAATFVSQKFPQRNSELFLIRCFLGGADKEQLLQLSDPELVEKSLADLESILGIKAKPELAIIYRWNKANPQYNVGHAAKIAGIEEALSRHPGLSVCGASYHGVGIPDCIKSGNESAEKVRLFLQK